MAAISPDVSSRLKPDLIKVVHKIYVELCNLQPDQKVLVISESKGMANKGVPINLIVKKERVKFEVNLAALKKEKFKVSSNLLKHAILIP